MNISFIEWILNKLRKNNEEDEWQPESLRIEDRWPDDVVREEEKEEEKKVIIIDL